MEFSVSQVEQPPKPAENKPFLGSWERKPRNYFNVARNQNYFSLLSFLSVLERLLLMAKPVFDERLKLVTSHFFSPSWLAYIRLLIAFYALFVSMFTLIWEALGKSSGNTAQS